MPYSIKTNCEEILLHVRNYYSNPEQAFITEWTRRRLFTNLVHYLNYKGNEKQLVKCILKDNTIDIYMDEISDLLLADHFNICIS